MGDLIIVGDRVLIEPEEGEKQTASGLVLPASVTDREKVASGRVIRIGPGYLTANPEYAEDESWKPAHEAVRYLPLQAQPGDVALYLRKEAIEITYENTPYVIIHHGAILALVRPDPEDILDSLGGLEDA